MKKRNRLKQPHTTSKRHAGESGIALLTVLALLSIFAVVLVGFTYTIRMEEFTVEQYADSVNVKEYSEAAVQGALSQLAQDLDPSNENYILGRRQPGYISRMGPWATGYWGRIGDNVTYNARSHQIDLRSDQLLRRQNVGLKVYPTPMPLGVDEDPAGDVTGGRLSSNIGQTSRSGDGAPGLAGIDDNLDGRVDHKMSEDDQVQLPLDDDEDYREDEDGLDLRRPDAKQRGNTYFAQGTGYDADSDSLGVFDESAKINLNYHGNNAGHNNSNDYTYNLGVTPAEVDLEVFLYGRVFRFMNTAGNISTFNLGDARDLASRIVNFRYGATSSGGEQNAKPGVDNEDDNDNNLRDILEVVEYNQAMNVTDYEGDPFVIVGDGEDNDRDGFLNEEDEVYIGPSTIQQGGSAFRQPIGSDTISDVKQFRPGDRIDNDGDGRIDEQDEGVDEPGEFSVSNPQGDDRPFTTVEDLRMLQGIPQEEPEATEQGYRNQGVSLFRILRDSVTVYGESDEVSGPLSGRHNDIMRLNPNGISNWRATDVYERGGSDRRADFQYSPSPTIEDFLVLQFDKDGDWQAEAESDITDGVDNDGDGLIDEPSDDWDGNLYPSSDFDGFSESDVGTSAYADGQDNDQDGSSQDEARGRGEKIGRLRNFAEIESSRRPRDISSNVLRLGMVAEGNGIDDDGDTLIDDDGDFNGDGLKSYDPEWHVTEDPIGDANNDGFPGLGADPESEDGTEEGDIVRRPSVNDETLVTSFADDDWDGYADFYDPQVLAAMHAPELDGVDNDGDGEVDEVGERYIAVFDDDEDGRYDEDPPDFQIALNLVDSIDTWMPDKQALDEAVESVLSKSETQGVLSDPVTKRTFTVYSSRQRAFRMNPWIMAGVNESARDRRLLEEQMRFLLPNPPETGMEVDYEGVEAIRINEVLAKPKIVLEAEDTLDYINPADERNPIRADGNRFEVVSGAGDDGEYTEQGTGREISDTSWGIPDSGVNAPASEPGEASFLYYPQGFRNTRHSIMPLVNMDLLSPAFIFSVTNTEIPEAPGVEVGRQGNETAVWSFENIPAGVYDVVLYLHPEDRLNPNVEYTINGQTISFRSDYVYYDEEENEVDVTLDEQVRRDTAVNPYAVRNPNLNNEFRLHYRLTPYPLPNKENVLDPAQRVEVGSDGRLEVEITARAPESGSYWTSFDRIELINLGAQYVELVNLSTEDIDLSGWTVNTPYGHYVLPQETEIGKMRPLYKGDDGTELREDEGIPGTGVPFDPLVDPDRSDNNMTRTERMLDNNKLLLAYSKPALENFIENNYPQVYELSDKVVQPILSPNELAMINESVSTGENEHRPNAQMGDRWFRVVDTQEDMLTHNPEDKHITLHDPAGGYIDSFKYRTTFNNVLVDIPKGEEGAYDGLPDLLVAPGYKGFEAYERADPTHFETELVANNDGEVRGERSVPSSIKLDAKQAIIQRVEVNNDGSLSFGEIGGYTAGTDPNNSRLQRFNDAQRLQRVGVPTLDPMWNGWDFIGDYYKYDEDLEENEAAYFARESMTYFTAKEAGDRSDHSPVGYQQMLGGFENGMDMSDPRIAQVFPNGTYTAFTWRMGARELIRAGYDAEVDDQLTVRVLGRKFVDDAGNVQPIDLPVGEVLVYPVFRFVDPGNNVLGEKPSTQDYEGTIHFAPNNNRQPRPRFAKLRNGDTAFTVDLRENYNDLWRDLQNESGSEPMIELIVILRKTTPDLNPWFQSNNEDLPLGVFDGSDRPDLDIQGGQPVAPNINGYYPLAGYSQQNSSALASMADDNYFFKGIEMFGRGRRGNNQSEQHKRYLAGTPGRNNTGYVPAYPRRRYEMDGNNRDEYDVVDNTAYVKNGKLATLGEISRLHTGNRFETINTPIIPQRLEDRAMDTSRVESNPDLGRRVNNNNEYRIRLAQRERLDQWENQYMQIYNMITTSLSSVVSGKINVNTAPREVLASLPFCPRRSEDDLESIQTRYNFNTICADFVLEGRLPGGHDYVFGVHNLDDDHFLHRTDTTDTMSDYKFPSVGREERAYKEFEDIEKILDAQNIDPEDIRGNRINFNNVYLSTIVSQADDGPYSDIGTLLSQMTHLRRRERFSEPLRRQMDRTHDTVKEYPGDLRERLNEINHGYREDLTPEDMETMMNRISNLITVRSRSFSVVTQGRIFDRDGNIQAQRKLETVWQR